jgi:hypothetical protein
VRLTTLHHKKLLLRNLRRGGQGPIWAVEPLDGWMIGSFLYKIKCKWENKIRNLSSDLGSRTVVIS